MLETQSNSFSMWHCRVQGSIWVGILLGAYYRLGYPWFVPNRVISEFPRAYAKTKKIRDIADVLDESF